MDQQLGKYVQMRKDEALADLAGIGNVAQFVAFRPSGRGGEEQTHSRVIGYSPDHRFISLENAATTLLSAAPEGRVNVRSFEPENPRSREFVYGLKTVDQVTDTARRLLASGLYVILNETIDVHDGGVSGVAEGDIVEFAPDDTPRCVEKPGTAAYPRDMAMRLLDTVYGFSPDLPKDGRVEFSVHPCSRGFRSTRTLLWEREPSTNNGSAVIAWPNRFSRHLGDKLHGLLMAHLVGLPVPWTLAIPRRMAPFSFGSATGCLGTWTRTCPTEQEPGLFTTVQGWTDPFALLAREDPEGERIAAVLSQAAVAAQHSGAAVTEADGTIVVEGVAGAGDLFMLSERPPEPLPDHIVRDVKNLCRKAAGAFGPVRLEWAHDGSKAWLIQLHAGAVSSKGDVLVEGQASKWTRFDVTEGLVALRQLLDGLGEGVGVVLIGDFGRTSHIADLMRRAGRPARVERP